MRNDKAVKRNRCSLEKEYLKCLAVQMCPTHVNDQGFAFKVQDAKYLGPDGALWNESTLQRTYQGTAVCPDTSSIPPDNALDFHGFSFPAPFMKVGTDLRFRD